MGFAKGLSERVHRKSFAEGASDVFDVPQVQKYLKKLARISGSTGWRKEHYQIAGHLKKETRKQFASHASPTGSPWETLKNPTKIDVGEPGMIRRPDQGDAGSARGFERWGRWIRIKTAEQGLRAARNVSMVAYTNLAGKPALYRPSGYKKATTFYKILTGRKAARVENFFLEFGFPDRLHNWVSQNIQYGGTFKGNKVPPRVMVDWSPERIAYAEKAYADGLQKRLDDPTKFGVY